MVWDVSPQPETKRVWAEVSLKRISIVSWLWSPATLRVAVPERHRSGERRVSTRHRLEGERTEESLPRNAPGGASSQAFGSHRADPKRTRVIAIANAIAVAVVLVAVILIAVVVVGLGRHLTFSSACLECPFRAL